MDKEKITAMREGGKILGNLLRDIKKFVQPGKTGKEADEWTRKYVAEHGATCAYDELVDDPFPGAICISVNDELVHGTPKDVPFEAGDKVSFDMVIRYKGYCVDAATTMIVGGKGSPAVKNMIRATEESLYAGIREVKPGAHIGDLGHAVEKVLRKNHLGVIENYVGHGIGKEMHMEPEIPNYGHKGTGPILSVGQTICIEPMSCLGKPANYADKDDNWTVHIKDGSIGCHVEHTILVTETGHEILTLPD